MDEKSHRGLEDVISGARRDVSCKRKHTVGCLPKASRSFRTILKWYGLLYDMAIPSQIQALSLPQDLPFRVISQTIGQGAYAFIRKACPHDAPQPVIAVKFINKQHAYKYGHVKPKQIIAEVALHNEVGIHQNIIQFLSTGEDTAWRWIAMELARGDLFDKIEADVGVGQDIAHFYFTQLISAVGYMHSKGVAHRDIKPENLLLSDGDLKLSDFGLAALYWHKGQTKKCTSVCGSPPYMAPEVVPHDGFTGGKTAPYDGNMSDLWSCGIVLFVLLVGNTPWDEPTRNSPEFYDYIYQQPLDELWDQIPHEALSLIRGILSVDPARRFNLEDIRRHPWFTRRNPHLAKDGRPANPVGLATQMLENLHIDFTADPMASSQRSKISNNDAMDVDNFSRLALTQPETPITETTFDWEQPVRAKANAGVSASQPVGGVHDIPTIDRFSEDPALSQFSATPAVPLSVTQQARRFRDILPEDSMARFLSFMDFPLLLSLLSEALDRLAIHIPSMQQIISAASVEQRALIPIKTRDQRSCVLGGRIDINRRDEETLEVSFVKIKGDPLEWRRLFKKVAVLCKDGILRPDE